MALTKVEFVNGPLEVFTVQDEHQEKWMVANPFAEALGYKNCANVISKFVSAENQKIYEEIKSPRFEETDDSSLLPRNVQAKTKFINRAGVFELISASEMPAAKRFKTWNTNDLLPTLCAEGEYSMSRDAPSDIAAENTQIFNKFQFANLDLEIVKIKDRTGQLWMLANPFARILKYSNAPKAIATYVSENNQLCLEKIQSAQVGQTDDSLLYIQPKSKFINRAGLFELIQASKMPRAQEFKQWIGSNLLPKLCQEGEYSMSKDAPSDIVQGMNAVHAATNEGREAPWMKDLTYMKTTIVEKDRKINELTTALTNSNEKLVFFATALVDSNNGLMKANETIGRMADRIIDLAQDVVTKPSNPNLCHSLAVCSLGGDQYAFLRPQKRNMKRSLDRLSVDNREIVFKSEYVPNAMNVLNKVKENLPKDKFKARHNKITLLEDLTKEDLVDAIDRSLTQRQVAIIAKNAFSNSKVDYM
ncbi:BRO-M [Lymantria xylina nucleopolyhedrovirus]|uniref:BRO-M n=1 Tax=Lymantria xylina multiple nucleopolyhedrovirus TaxID=2847840 RepID=D4N2I4_9ABAC|nr:BRO-M [Lymantria xylina nucleopolyhedrovirus]ADD73856.1 BRO-M [Lymantria xylina nucleopolyhedrovirus]